MKWLLQNISDDVYFNTLVGNDGANCQDTLWVSNSWLKDVFKTNLNFMLTHGREPITDELQEVFDVGSAFHTYILENREFYKRYYVSDVINPSLDKKRVATSDFDFIEKSSVNIEKAYPTVLDGKLVELTLTGEIDGVKVKCKMDKIIITRDKANPNKFLHVEILDLKGVYFNPFSLAKSSNGDRWKLRKMLSNNDYDLQAYFYTKLVEEWLLATHQNCSVTFSLLVTSKDTHQCQKFQVGAEMMLSGEEKFKSVWGDVVDFVRFGKIRLNDYEVL